LVHTCSSSASWSVNGVARANSSRLSSERSPPIRRDGLLPPKAAAVPRDCSGNLNPCVRRMLALSSRR
jgi:hypothetical protein